MVFVNKGLYAKCPRSDKTKISKGIVAAVRELGGRFLELDERSGIYKDIGDKKATEKTSQALREGQTKIRKQMYNDEKKAGAGGAQTHDTSLLASSGSVAAPASGSREISSEGYFGYSIQVLESLYLDDEGGGRIGAAQALPPHQQQQQRRPGAPPPKYTYPPPPGVRPHPAATAEPPAPVPSDSAAFFPDPSSGDANAAAIARALEQFPGAAAAIAKAQAEVATAAKQQQRPPQPQPMEVSSDDNCGVQPPHLRESDADLRPSMGRLTGDSLDPGRPSIGRLTNVSMASIFSLTQLLESARDRTSRSSAGAASADDHGSVRSALSDEIRDLIRLSETQLVQVEGLRNDEDVTSHVDREVNLLFDEEAMKDRVSELRFTDVGRDVGGGAGGDYDCDRREEPNPRMTDSTESTNYSRTSLMDASMMTIGTEDMSLHSGLEKRKRQSNGKNEAHRETADLLLRLSAEQGKI